MTMMLEPLPDPKSLPHGICGYDVLQKAVNDVRDDREKRIKELREELATMTKSRDLWKAAYNGLLR